MKIKIGCGEWGFRELPVPEHFQIARKFGFRTLEIGIGGGKAGRLPTHMTHQELSAFHKLCTDHQIATPHCCLENDFTLPAVADHEAMVKNVLPQIELASRLGSTHVRLFAGFTPARAMTETIWQRMLDAFRQCDALCQRLGLVIAIETHGKITLQAGAAMHEPTVSTDRASVARLLKDLPPRVGFNFDPGNLKAVAPADKTLLVDLLNDRINYCHLKDWRRKGAGWEAGAIGDDDLDYAVLLPKLRYDGVCLIEYEPTADVEAGIGRSLDYLRRIGAQLEFA
jgi:sugar phosphate isomerase/epimerase